MIFWHKSNLLKISCSHAHILRAIYLLSEEDMNAKEIAEKYQNQIYKYYAYKTEIRNSSKTNTNVVLAAVLVDSFVTCFSELAGCKVSHGCLQHHHHPWRHHHRRQHNQHDVHQLFQRDLIFRIPTTALSPWHVLPSFSGWAGLPPEDFRWLQFNAQNNLTTFTIF